MNENIDIIKQQMLEISNYYDGYPFTHKQAYEIKNILERKFDPECVKRFICELRNCCEGAACLLDQPDYKTYKNDRKSMLAILEKCSGIMDGFRKGELSLCHLSNYPLLVDDKRQELDSECQQLAFITGELLNIFMRKIKLLDDSNESRLRGRPTADSKGIIAEIVKIWETCFNVKPTKYLEGTFVEVVKIALEGLNLKYEYPQRKINAAFKKQVTKLK